MICRIIVAMMYATGSLMFIFRIAGRQLEQTDGIITLILWMLLVILFFLLSVRKEEQIVTKFDRCHNNRKFCN